MPSPIERYQREIVAELGWRPVLARRVLLEATDHLALATIAHRQAGLSAESAEAAAVREFGPATEVVAAYGRAPVSLGLLLALGTGSTALIALWLGFVTTFVLPTHDPAHVAMWRILAGLFAGFALVSVTLLGAPERLVRRWLAVATSVAAIAFGSFAVSAALGRRPDGQDSEGYLLLMGVLLAGHGVVALTFALLSARIPTHRSRPS